MATKTPRIDLRLSQASIKDLERFRKELEATQKRTQELKQDYKQMADLLKSMELRSIAQSRGGLKGFLGGKDFQQGLKIEDVNRLATKIGQAMKHLQRLTSLAQQGLKYSKDQATVQQALNLNLRTRAAQIKKINSLEEATRKLKAAQLRMGLEAANGNKRQEQSARRIAMVLEERVRTLKEEKKVQDQITAARTRNIELEQAQADRQRRQTMNRLFGDGGASLFAIQAGLIANYAAINTVREGASQAVTFTVDLDEALRNLQAITVTTDGNLSQLKDTLIKISEATKFTAVEVSNASVTLGQAGLAVREIERAVPSVALLATATGTDLARAVDIATSTLGVFQMESGQLAHVADTMTAAVNNSKLNIEKLTLGLQYSGNTAAQSGVKFEELTSALGAMANAGIRAGSTLGTGMRQILIALQKPSTAFSETLSRLGLSMHDIDVRSQGLYGALSNLKEAGFTSADAIKVFEVRAAAAFNALSANLDSMLSLQEAFLSSAAAAEANETQMRSLANQSKRFGSIFGSVMETALEPFLYLLRDILKGLGDLFTELRQYEGTLKAIGVAAGSAAAALAVFLPLKLIRGLGRLIFGTEKLSKGLDKVSKAAKSGIGRLGRFGTLLAFLAKGFRLLTGPIGAITVGLGFAVSAFVSWRKESGNAQVELDRLKSSFDNATGAMEETGEKIETVSSEIEHLQRRSESLQGNNRAMEAEIRRVREQFVDMGLDVSNTDTTIDELIETLKNLRGELAEEFLIKIRIAAEELDNVMTGRDKVIEQSRSRASGITSQFNNRVNDLGLMTQSGPGTFLDISGQAQDPSLSSVELQANRKILLDRKAMLDGVMADGRVDRDERELFSDIGAKNQLDVERYIRAELEGIDPLVMVLDALITNTKAQEADAIRSGNLKTEARIAEQRQRPEVLAVNEQLTDLSASLPGRFDALDKGSAGDTLEKRLAAARALRNDALAEIEDVRRALFANKVLDPALVDEIMTEANNLEATLMDQFQPYLAAFKEEEDALREVEMEKIARELQFYQKQQKDASNDKDIRLNTDHVLDLLRKQAEMEVDAIRAGDDTDTVQAAKIAEVYAALNEASVAAIEARKELLKDFEGLKIEAILKNLETEFDRLEADRTADGATEERIVSSLTRQKELLERMRQQELEKLQLQDMPDFQRLSEEAALNQSFDERSMGLQDSADSQLEALAQTAAEQIRTQMDRAQSDADRRDATLLAQLEEATDPAEVVRLTNAREDNAKEMLQKASDFVEMLRELGDVQIGEYEDILDAFTDLIDQISSDADDRLGDLEELAQDRLDEARDKQIEIARQEMELAEAAIANADELADQATTLAERNKWLNEKIKAIRDRLAAALRLIGLQLADNPEAAAIASEATTLEAETDITETRGDIGKPFKKSGGGGGKTTSAEEKYRNRLENLLEIMNFQMEAGNTSFRDGSAVVNNLLSEAQGKVGELTARINSMAKAAAMGTLSTEEQEKLNDLLDERRSLHEMIKQQEAESLRIAKEHASILEAIPMVMQDWANQNLNLRSTLFDGISNALGAAKNALTELFTTLTDGTKSGKEAFKQMAGSILKAIQQIFAEMLAVYILQKAMGFFGIGTGGAGLGGLFGLSNGGMAKKAADGTYVKGNLNRDSVPYQLMDGEYVLRRSAVQAIGKDKLDQLNAMGNRSVAQGAHHGVAAPSGKGGSGGAVNVYVVAPDQKPVPGPKDIVAILGDDIQRNGSTKQLIRSVMMGDV